MQESVGEGEEKSVAAERATGFAVLTGDRLSSLLEPSDASRARTYKQEQVPGMPGAPVSCEWRLGVDGKGAPHSAEIELRRNGVLMGEMKVRIEKSSDGTPVWNIWHRFVNEEERGVGVGTYALKTVESFIEGLSHKAGTAPPTLEFHLSQPSVIDFAVARGYTFDGGPTGEQASVYARFKEEAKQHAEDPAFLEQGELPSFQLVKLKTEDGKSKDMVLIDKEKLRSYAAEHGSDPASYFDADMKTDPRTGEETDEIASQLKSLSLTWDEFTGNEEQRLPFLYSVRMRKTLKN